MRLKTTAGAYAGQIRDYDFSAAQAALKCGTAEPLDAVPTTKTDMPRAEPQPDARQFKRRR